MGDVRAVVFVGLMAAGKTPSAAMTAARLGWAAVDADEVLEARTGETPGQYAEAHGLDALHEQEAQVLLDLLARGEPQVIAAAASIIEDERCRSALEGALVVWLHADPAFLAARAGDSDHRPASEDWEAVLRRQAERRDPLYAAAADVDFDVSRIDLDDVAAEVAELA